MAARTIDVNSDMGESFGAWTIGADAALVKIVSSANIACGFHAGDPLVMQRTIALCRDNDVSIGAHPGYADLRGFGRAPQQISPEQIRADVIAQIGAMQAMCRDQGVSMAHVKPHGALYNQAGRDPSIATAIVDAIHAVAPGSALFAQAGSELARIGAERGLRIVRESFADRAYLADGSLAPRSLEGSVLHDDERIREQVRRMITGEEIETLDGKTLMVPTDTICIHSDTPGADRIAALVQSAIYETGITIRARR